MDFDACQKAAKLRNQARCHVQAALVQGVRDAVEQDSVEASVTKRYLQRVLGCRIFTLNGPNVVPQRRKHAPPYYLLWFQMRFHRGKLSIVTMKEICLPAICPSSYSQFWRRFFQS
jgi:hypothetical protein